MFSAILDYLSEKYSGKIYHIILKEIFRDCSRELFKIRDPSFEELLYFSENRIRNFLKSCYEAYNNPEHYLEVVDLEIDYRELEIEFLEKFSK